MRPALAILAATFTVLAATGCGRERLPAPDVREPVVTRAVAEREFPREGLRLSLPVPWSVARGQRPLVVQSTSGTAAMAVWRYPRSEPLPDTDAELAAAREALLRAVRQRDKNYREISTRRVDIDGEPALELVGDQRIAGNRRRVRSTHVFAHGGEIVVDQFAEPADFERLDEAVFEPFMGALRLRAPR